MSRDSLDEADFPTEWGAIKAICRRHPSGLFPGVSFVSMAIPVEAFNIALLLAYGVLEQALKQCLRDGRFTCKVKDPSLYNLSC